MLNFLKLKITKFFSNNNLIKIQKQMEKNILKYESDRYDGVTIDESSLPESILDFEKILQDSLSLWQKEKKRGIWLKIPKTKSDLIPIAIKQGLFNK